MPRKKTPASKPHAQAPANPPLPVPASQSSRGRPSKLTPAKIAEVRKILSRCAYVETAAAGIGISRDTFYNWLRDGARLEEKQGQGQVLTPAEQLLVDFSDTVKKEQAFAEVRLLDVIHRAAQSTWPAAAWILERTRPERYSRKDRQILENPDGSALADPLIEALNRVYGAPDEEEK